MGIARIFLKKVLHYLSPISSLALLLYLNRSRRRRWPSKCPFFDPEAGYDDVTANSAKTKITLFHEVVIIAFESSEIISYWLFLH